MYFVYCLADDVQTVVRRLKVYVRFIVLMLLLEMLGNNAFEWSTYIKQTSYLQGFWDSVRRMNKLLFDRRVLIYRRFLEDVEIKVVLVSFDFDFKIAHVYVIKISLPLRTIKGDYKCCERLHKFIGNNRSHHL
jgi:hypothetical protein